LKSSGFDDKPEIRLGMMLGDYRVDADLGRKTLGTPKAAGAATPFRHQPRLFSVDEAGLT
jgi:hypothetical protein